MNLASIIGICVVVAAVSVVLRGQRPEMALLAGLAASAVVLAAVVVTLNPALSQVRDALDDAGASTPYVDILFKALGICYITQFACDACADAGETALANKISLAGKALMIIIALPMFAGVLEMITGLIK